MDEYINRSKLEFDFRQCNRTDSNWTPHRVVQMIHRQPAADVAPVVHGQWEGYSHYRDRVVYYCSICRRKTVIKEKYCPNCGAKMDLEV